MDFQQPPPKGWDQFEDLCADIFELEWQDPMLVRHGRAGQAQNGVDIVGRHGADWPVGVQCKNKSVWPIKRVTIADLDKEVAEAKMFRPKLKAFYLVSTAPNDNALQAHVRKINEDHLAKGLFPVAVFGWDEIERRAKRHPAIAARHFGAFAENHPTPLIASWRARDHRLLIPDAELSAAIREVTHDLRRFPKGRVVVRQHETEALQTNIQRLRAASKGTLTERETILDALDKLKLLEDREKRVVLGITAFLGQDPIRDYIRVVWSDAAATIIRGFVEQELDPDHAIVTGLEKIRMFYPDGSEYIAVFVPPALISEIDAHRRALKIQFPKLATDNVGELPKSVLYPFAIPAILSRATTGLEDGKSVKDLDARQWFDLERWRVKY